MTDPLSTTLAVYHHRPMYRVDRMLLLRAVEVSMRYIAAWALGVPFSVIVVWYVFAHAGC